MTNEYATKVLKRIQYGTTYPVYEALDMAIEALSAQIAENTCENTCDFKRMSHVKDTIYRQDAINKFEPWLKVEGYSEGELNMLKAILYELTVMPSAQAERKKGEWIEAEVTPKAFDVNGIETWASKMQCDQCGFITYAIEGHMGQYNFCPNCGADMRGE